MSRSYLFLTIVLALTALAVPVRAQVLTCSDAGSGECRFVHYHVSSYNDATRNFIELHGTNRFATIEACETERTRRMGIEKQVVAHVKKVAARARVEESKFGPCHCDMTSNSSSRYFLDDDARFERIHLQRNITLLLLEEAYDKGLPTDSPLALGLASLPTTWASSLWPTVSSMPPESSDRFLTIAPPVPRKTEISVGRTGQLDTSRYEMIEITFGSEIPLETVSVDQAHGTSDLASEFVNAEIAEVQSHFSTVLAMDEGPQKEQLLELIQQRLQLLSNFSRLVQTAGPSSALASRVVAARNESTRRALVGRMFGPSVVNHWSSDSPEALLIDLPDAIVTDPIAVLRDSGRRFSQEERQLALYVFLMRTGGLTENQEIWLSGIIESYLAEGAL